VRLFIAEKPSMGREISKYLPEQKRIQKNNGFIVQGDDIVTWAFGHVLEQAEPGDYDEKYKRWRAEDLPIVPIQWKLLVTESSKAQFETIKMLIGKADTIVNAGDPDREGQLLIDEILHYVGTDKPVQRILLNALDEKSVRAALNDLRDNKDFYNLQQSALARSRADWLMGMNLSRAYTLAERRKGHKVTLPIGRVKTPTLSLVVRRERELDSFIPVDYFTLKMRYNHANGAFWATWQPKDEQKGLDPDGRLLDETIAQELATKLLADPQALVHKVTKSKKKEGQRLPLSLSALQVLAGKAFGYDPKTVLDVAQRLYERKLTSYPRSDCDYLPTNQYGDRGAVVRNLIKCGDQQVEAWARGANLTIKSKCWNDKKITAHHAIIPTTVAAKMDGLSQDERNIYHLIAQAYLAQFYSEHVYEQTKIEVVQQDEIFAASGRVVIEPGWKALYARKKKSVLATDSGQDQIKTDSLEEEDEADLTDDRGAEIIHKREALEDSDNLPHVKKKDSLTAVDKQIDKKATKPPSRFTAATLLQAMKEIHKFVKNEDLKKQLKAVSGIGTEATRATIIEELISRGFMKETGKKKILTPTENAYLLVDALPEELIYPDETALWEERLANMSEGQDTLQDFLDDQIAFLRKLIEKLAIEVPLIAPGGMQANITRTIKRNEGGRPLGLSPDQLDKLETCPECGQGKMMIRKGKFGQFYGCTNYPKCRYTKPLEESNGSLLGLPGPQVGFDPQRSVSPVEDIDVPQDQQLYRCPRCKQGYLVPVPKGNNQQWICSKRSTCKTTVSDVEGKPVAYANK